MSTITPLQLNDNGAVSLASINANFAALNADKIEAASVVTFIGKTIDADNNTITNLETDNFKASALSGSDTTLITGTAGATGRLAKFNADNDLVDAGVEVSTDDTLGGSTPSDQKVPTEQATKSYLDGKLKNAFMMTRPTGGSGTSTTTIGNQYQMFYMNSVSDQVSFEFMLPTGYTSIASAKLVLVHNHTTATVYTLDGDATFGGSGELYDNTSDADTFTTGTLSQKEVEIIDVTTTVSAAGEGDWVNLKFQVTGSTSGTYALAVGKLVVEFAE